MSSSNGRAKLSEKGLLTPDNCVVALIDHQPQMLFGVSNFDRQPPSMTAAESLFGEKLQTYSAYMPSLEAAHRVGSVVVHELVTNWAKYENETPQK